jgi:hypothetical protein
MDAGYSIYKVDANGNVSTFITNLNSHWYGMAFDSNNNLCYSSSDGKKIYKIDTNGNTTTFIDSNDIIMARSDVLSSPKSLAFDSNGNLYICNSNSINKYNSAGILINKTFISIPNVNINNLIIDKNDIYIIYSDSNNSYVNKYNINGNLIYNIYTDPTNSILGLAIDSIGNITFINNNGTIFTYKLGVPPINICFPKGTPIETDQGTFAIDHIADILERTKLILTINRKPIIAISQTLSTEKTLVCFDSHALGPNIPNKPTIVSPEHKVGYNGHLMSAKYFVKHSLQKKIYEIPHCSDDILYNVLLDDYSVIKVNNLSVETLHPQNPIAVIQKNNIEKESDKNKQK